MDFSTLYAASAWVLPVVLAVTLHEASHGFVAERFGDDTARAAGRVTFNPLRHIDPAGTILIPALLLLLRSPVLFGYAKPVPVDFHRLKPKRLGMLAVAAAGPGMNILLAMFCALLLGRGIAMRSEDMSWWSLNLLHGLLINCALAVFNMVPILPLDGGRVLRAMLPGAAGRLYARTERYGLPIVIFLLMLPSWLGMTFFTDALAGATAWLIGIVLFLTGNLPALGA